MARSAQLSFLQRLAADHATAARLGLPVDEYRDLRDEARADAPDSPSRRALLRVAAAAGIGAATLGAGLRPTRAAAAVPMATGTGTPRIAVIGAGISGLNAALTLADKGVGCTVYEANPSRIGGRMYSQGSPANPGYWAQGQVSEYGGELVDTGHKTIQDLCTRFGLELTPVRHVYGAQADQVLWVHGGYYARSQADIDFKPVWQNIQNDVNAGNGYQPTWNNHTAYNVTLDNMSVRDWINSRVPGGYASNLGAFLDVAYNVEYGADTVNQSSYALLCLLAWQANPGSFNIWGGSDERYHITGGNDQLPHAIAATLPAGTVKHGYTLQAVVRNSDGTQTLTFALDGGGTATVVADHTILTVPLAVLQQRVDLSRAGLDPMMQGVFANMTMGMCTKLNMQFNSRSSWTYTGAWPGSSNGEMFTDMTMQQCWDVTRGQSGTDGILVQYGGGSLAAGLTPPAPFTDTSVGYTNNLAKQYLAQLEKVFPGTTAAWTGRALLSDWPSNPYSLGAYSCWPVGYVTKYAGYEGTAQGNLHIAGEHTSYNFQGYMNGGAQEGARAGNEVLTAIGK